MSVIIPQLCFDSVITTFTTPAVQTIPYTTIRVSCLSVIGGTLALQASFDGITWSDSEVETISANTLKSFTYVIPGKFVRFEAVSNSSGNYSLQTFFFDGGNGGDGSSGVLSVTATAPVVATGSQNVDISLPVSTDAADGYMSAADHALLTATAAKIKIPWSATGLRVSNSIVQRFWYCAPQCGGNYVGGGPPSCDNPATRVSMFCAIAGTVNGGNVKFINGNTLVQRTITLYKNGSATSIAMSLTTSNSTATSSNTVSVSAGDYLVWEVNNTGAITVAGNDEGMNIYTYFTPS